MSYILDALRKSDAQRRLGQSPDLASAPSQPLSGPSPRPRRMLAVLALVLAVMAVPAALWWGGPLQDWVAGFDRDTASAQPSADSQSRDATIDQDAETVQSETAPAQLAEAEHAAEAAPLEEPAAVDRRSPAQRPVTVVSRPAPQRAVDVPRPPVERERPVESAEEAQRLIEEAQMTRRRTRTPAPAAPAEQTAPTATVAAPAAPAAEAAAPAQTDPEPWAPERSDFVRRWELPLAIRRDLPELSLSIHVFSAQPRSRFVLINGERKMEGDELGQGARLVEIRREGALVEFRDYRFLLEP